jgi:hypothetical protein
MDLVNASIASGRAHLAHADGGILQEPHTWGWRKDGDTWRPYGDCIGWVDDAGEVYLESNAAYAVAEQFAVDQGDTLSVSIPTLKRRLDEEGVLASKDIRGGKTRFDIRRTLAGKRRAVLHVKSDALGSFPSDTGGPSGPMNGFGGNTKGQTWATPWATSQNGPVDQQVAHTQTNEEALPRGNGPLGPLMSVKEEVAEAADGIEDTWKG